ncbi:hypothetical protein ElyMa_001994400 [Elysia marginata]|uniref:Transposase Tc1-like domain-containing protein n=1 Tax=Elysia marginata TaxID=1093978 RepID=A0AAV4F2W2_9GAST|nr:hypothetical protein ElyMa_001994400 [Elysia marginata]
MNVNRTTIFRLRLRLHETDTVSDRPRSGRPRCTTQRQERNLVRNHMNNRFFQLQLHRVRQEEEIISVKCKHSKKTFNYLWPTCSSPISAPS